MKLYFFKHSNLILTGTILLIIYVTKINIRNFVTIFSTNIKYTESHLRESSEFRIIYWNRNNSPDKFCVWFNYTKATKALKKYSVSLCTHGTIEYSKFIFDHVKYWDDLISVSFILDASGFYALRSFQKLYQCFPEAAEKISAHLVWRANNENECSKSFIINGLLNLRSDSNSFDCNLDDKLFDTKLFNNTFSTPYPPNSLRNIARKGASTNFHLIADIENHFSMNTSKILSAVKYLNEHDKVGVIVRRFEYNDTFSAPPRTVKELNELMKRKQAFEFHHHFYAKGHQIPGLNAWIDYSSTEGVVPNLTAVNYQGSTWEPQLVVHSSYPYHFEGFPIRFEDQQALPHELCRAGYSFAVASHVFSFHKGIKKLASKKELLAKEKVVTVAAKTKEKFLKYLDDKYIQTKSKCS